MICFTLLVVSQNVFAGKIKGVLIDHEESIHRYFAQKTQMEVLDIRKSRFVKPLVGYDFAIESQVTVAEIQKREYIDLSCTSEFSKNPMGDDELKLTHCDNYEEALH